MGWETITILWAVGLPDAQVITTAYLYSSFLAPRGPSRYRQVTEGSNPALSIHEPEEEVWKFWLMLLGAIGRWKGLRG